MAHPLGDRFVLVQWMTNPWRGDRFEELWTPVAEAALDYGARGWAFYRDEEERAKFIQLAFFDTKAMWERYWYSDYVSEKRSDAGGLFQVPLLPVWQKLVGFGSRELVEVGE